MDANWLTFGAAILGWWSRLCLSTRKVSSRRACHGLLIS